MEVGWRRALTGSGCEATGDLLRGGRLWLGCQEGARSGGFDSRNEIQEAKRMNLYWLPFRRCNHKDYCMKHSVKIPSFS